MVSCACVHLLVTRSQGAGTANRGARIQTPGGADEYGGKRLRNGHGEDCKAGTDRIDWRAQLAASRLESQADGKATGLDQSREHQLVNTIVESDEGSCSELQILQQENFRCCSNISN